jgi:hypothetical protein
MHSNEPPPLLSKSFASISQKPSPIFSDNKRMRKNRENEREILTKRRSGGGIGLANAGLQVITFGIFRVSSLSDFCLHLSLLPASFLIRVIFLCFRLQVPLSSLIHSPFYISAARVSNWCPCVQKSILRNTFLMLRTWFDFFGARFESGNLNLRFLL